MNQTTDMVTPTVSPEEVERRLAEYRHLGFERQAMPHGVYEGTAVWCPWGGCGFRIGAIDFHIEKMGDPAFYKQVIAAWWLGPGIVARCPGCGKYVLFSIGGKQPVADPTAGSWVVLPDDWHHRAYLA